MVLRGNGNLRSPDMKTQIGQNQTGRLSPKMFERNVVLDQLMPRLPPDVWGEIGSYLGGDGLCFLRAMRRICQDAFHGLSPLSFADLSIVYITAAQVSLDSEEMCCKLLTVSIVGETKDERADSREGSCLGEVLSGARRKA